MDNQTHSVQEIRLDDLVPFQLHPVDMKDEEQLQELMCSIERDGLKTPITVRGADGDKYEIVLGHNRAMATRALGRDTIQAIVIEDMTDDDAKALFYGTYLTPQVFWGWSYLPKFRAIQYIVKVMQKNSHQGKRSDLIEKVNHVTHDNQGHHARRSTSRDRAAASIEISTATLSRYRSMVKLEDESVILMARLLDDKLLTFNEAYQVSLLHPSQSSMLLRHLEGHPEQRVDMVKLKEFRTKEAQIKTSERSIVLPIIVEEMLKPR